MSDSSEQINTSTTTQESRELEFCADLPSAKFDESLCSRSLGPEPFEYTDLRKLVESAPVYTRYKQQLTVLMGWKGCSPSTERMGLIRNSILMSGILRTASGNDILRSQHAVDAAEQGEAGYQDPIVYSHEWEHAIYEGRKVPEDHRKHVQLHGFGGTPGHPWLITGATGTDDRGQQFHWNSRRHRKGRSPAHKIPPPPHSAFRPLAWVDPRPFLISPKKLISWLSPILTMLGSTLFAINNASQASNHVQPWTMEPYQGHRLYDWIAATLAFAGLWVVLPGQYLKWVETLNTDYDMRIHNREQAGKKGHKPRLRFVGFRPQQVSYWGVLLRVLGAAVFVLAATDNWLNQTCHGYMKRIVEKQEVFQEAPVHMVNQDTVDSVDSAFVQLLQSMAA
ncbi:hypothetical protein WJX77_010434 [Trebouxia sp. C0004]